MKPLSPYPFLLIVSPVLVDLFLENVCGGIYLYLQFLLTAESTPVSTPILYAQAAAAFWRPKSFFLLVPGRSSRASCHLHPIHRGSLFTSGGCSHNANTCHERRFPGSGCYIACLQLEGLTEGLDECFLVHQN